ncbi:MAG TPA: CapA family protein [Gemmatimonadaceae bacterium]|nr:CapA family protein [Gemmatimonadaceae bacterium]
MAPTLARRHSIHQQHRTRLALLAALAGALAAGCSRPAPPPAPAPARAPIVDRDSIRRDSIARVRAAFVAESLSLVYAYRDTAKVRLCAGGDVTLGTNLDTTWTAFAARRLKRPVAAFPSPDSLLSPLRPLVAGADFVLLNVEGAIGDEEVTTPKCAKESTGCYALRMPPPAAGAIRRASGAVVVANLANNHARDAGAEGLRETVRRLTDAGVVVTGVDTLATLVPSRHGDTVAFLGFATSGAANDLRDIDAVRRHVARAAASYRRVVVTMHLGAEGAAAQRTGDSVERYLNTTRGNPVAFASAATGAGADLVIGHGPHVLRAVEWRGASLVLYSLGNLVTYGPFSHREPMRRGAIACATVDGKGAVSAAHLHPTVQRAPGLVRADRSRRALTLVDSLSRLDFPRSGARVLKDGRVVRR